MINVEFICLTHIKNRRDGGSANYNFSEYLNIHIYIYIMFVFGKAYFKNFL